MKHSLYLLLEPNGTNSTIPCFIDWLIHVSCMNRPNCWTFHDLYDLYSHHEVWPRVAAGHHSSPPAYFWVAGICPHLAITFPLLSTIWYPGENPEYKISIDNLSDNADHHRDKILFTNRRWRETGNVMNSLLYRMHWSGITMSVWRNEVSCWDLAVYRHYHAIWTYTSAHTPAQSLRWAHVLTIGISLNQFVRVIFEWGIWPRGMPKAGSKHRPTWEIHWLYSYRLNSQTSIASRATPVKYNLLNCSKPAHLLKSGEVVGEWMVQAGGQCCLWRRKKKTWGHF